jgi:ectoine hydroxylase-related dioxygenase (phytanoyl-CoA dioxygenase family)
VRAAFGSTGYLAREAVLTPDEVEELRAVVEEVSSRVTARATRAGAGPEAAMADGHRIQFSSRTAIQWEWADGSDQIRLLEPADHLHPRIDALFADERLLGPVRAELGERLSPFTSKMNFKRAREGSEFPWHQDFPYWYVAVGDDAQDVVTAVVFLDDATADNGALRVIPGSHLQGPARRDPNDPTRYLADPSVLDGDSAVLLELPAGSVLWFGAFLVHCSAPNRTPIHRRALLPSWQPAGRGPLRDFPYDHDRVEDLP